MLKMYLEELEHKFSFFLVQYYINKEVPFMKKAKDYIDLPYNYIIQPIKDESGEYYYARVLELDGCQSTGDTFEEAYNNLREAMEGWIETKLENGFKIPLPVGYENFSGKFIVSHF